MTSACFPGVWQKLHFKIAFIIALVVSLAGWIWMLAIFTKWLFVQLYWSALVSACAVSGA